MRSLLTTPFLSRLKFRALQSICLPLLFVVSVHAAPPTWAKVTPAEVTAAGIDVQLTGADYGNGVFVLATYFGGSNAVPAITPAVFTSSDGTTWTRRTLPVSGARVARPRFLNGKFFLGLDAATNNVGVPTGTNGAILTSTDGITWSALTLPTPLYGPNDFAYGNSVYVAVVAGVSSQVTQVLTSSDGVSWTPHTVAAGTSSYGIQFFSGKFYLTASGGTASGLYSSADGATWAKVAGAPAGPTQIAASPTTLLTTFFTGSGSAQALSADGVTFTTASPGLAYPGGNIRYLNGAFVAAAQASSTSYDDNQVSASTDGRTWTTIATTDNLFGAAELAYGNGRYVFVGEFNVFAGATTDSPGGGTGGGTETSPTNLAALSAAALAGKTLNFKISSGNAPFEATGSFTLVFDSPATGQYTIRGGVTGSVDAHTGVYVYNAGSGEGPHLELKNYFAGGGSAGLDLLFAGSATASQLTPGNAYFEMSGPGANKHGSFTISSSSGGGTPAPTIGAQPASQTVALGGSVTFTVTVTGTGLSYQWYFNGVALSGQINASLILSALSALNAGDYTVKITNAGGSVTSSAATLTVATPSNAGRIVNMSVRGNAGAGDQTLIVGLVIGGGGTSGTKPVLVRAVGPTLGTMGVTGFLADPKITAYSGGTAVATNDDWAGNADIAAAGARLGAQPFASAQSKDAAFYASPTGGAYTIHVTGPTTGVALAEIYDGTDTPTSTTPRLVNVSVRAQVGTGENLLIAGFVIGGSTPRTVLLRALGPTLTAAGVNGVLADPNIALYSGSTKIAENDNWSSAANAAAIITTSSTVGAGALASGTKDAVLLVTLQPGVYAAHVTGVGNTTGVALVEVFEVP